MTKARDIASAAPAPSTVSATELGYLDGVTSAIQTQVDAKTAKATLTTTGDMYYASSANTPARLAVGSTGNVLTVAAGIPSWAAPAAGGGFTLLSTTNVNGETTVSGINQGYKHLYIEVASVWFTGSDFIGFQLNNTVAASSFTCVGNNNGYFSGRVNQMPEMLQYIRTEAYKTQNFATIWIYDYTNTTNGKTTAVFANMKQDNGSLFAGIANAAFATTDAISSFKLAANGGSIQNSGTIKIYGVK